MVPDQLRISEGWVRCGRCDDIFDASLHLLQALPEETSPSDSREEVAANIEAEHAGDSALQTTEADPDSAHLASPDEMLAEQEQEQLLPDAAADEIEPASPGLILEVPAPVDAFIAESPGSPDAQTCVALPEPLDAEPILPVHVAQDDPDDLEPAPSADMSEVSFLSGKTNSSFWHRPPVRATLMLFSVALLLGLSGQIVFHERDRLVALQPGLKPWLQTTCAALDCVLSPLRRTESIVIDSSSFAQVRGDAYRLNFTVKNSADIAVAVPAIELTLTDARDRPVVRRVFLPRELHVEQDALAAGSEWSASLAMAVRVSGTSERVAGYRLLVFYP